MRLVIQRVSEAEVKVENEVIGKIGTGFLVLIGICEEDNEAVADKLLKKMIAQKESGIAGAITERLEEV